MTRFLLLLTALLALSLPANAQYRVNTGCAQVFNYPSGSTGQPASIDENGKLCNNSGVKSAGGVAPIGDSRIDQIWLDAPHRNLSAGSPFAVGNALSGHRAVWFGAFGVSGDRTDQINVRVPAALATNPAWLLYMGGVNDIGQNFPAAGTSGATAAANILIAVQAAAAQGVGTILVTDPGATTLTAAQIGQLNILNEKLREMAERQTMVVLIDLARALQNPTNSTTAIAFGTNYMRDTLHPGNLGGYIGGKAVAAVFQAIFPPRPFLTTNIIETPSATSLTGLLVNPLYSTASGGTCTAGACTGTVAGSWTVDRSAAATSTAVASVQAAGDGSPGNEQVLVVTCAAGGEEIRLRQDATPANIAFGDILSMTANVTVDASATGLSFVTAYVGASVDSVTTEGYDGFGLAGGACGASCVGNDGTTYSAQLASQPFAVPAGALLNFVTGRIRIGCSGAGTATIRVKQAQLRKRFAL